MKTIGGVTIIFEEVTLSDKPLFDKYFKSGEYEGSECTFTNLYMWRKCYEIKWTVIDGMLCIKAVRDNGNFILPPFGDYSDPRRVKKVLDELSAYFKEQGMLFQMKGVYRPLVEYFEKHFSRIFRCNADRDNFDYVYNAVDLIELKGRKFHGKKNHANAFRSAYLDYKYVPLTKEYTEACIEFEKKWCEQRNCDDDPSLKCEQCAVTDVMRNIDSLSFVGGVILINGQVEAFTFGEKLNTHTALIHVEKANPDIRGLYAVINQDFCRAEWTGMTYINREEDMGIEGLRKAKESYRPVKMIEKYDLVLQK